MSVHPMDTAIKLLLFFELVFKKKVPPPKKHSLFRNNTLMQSWNKPPIGHLHGRFFRSDIKIYEG